MKFRTSRSPAYVKPFHFNKESRVQEQFAYDCDINNIVNGMTAPMPIRTIPDVEEIKKFTPDMYEQALLTKAAAENAFNDLPSSTRIFFDNDPAKMLAFIGNPENAEKCIELGLAKRRDVTLSDINTSLKDLSVNNPTITESSVTPQEGSGS